jgi:hypothetical protein
VRASTGILETWSWLLQWPLPLQLQESITSLHWARTAAREPRIFPQAVDDMMHCLCDGCTDPQTDNTALCTGGDLWHVLVSTSWYQHLFFIIIFTMYTHKSLERASNPQTMAQSVN